MDNPIAILAFGNRYFSIHLFILVLIEENSNEFEVVLTRNKVVIMVIKKA